MNKIKKGDDVIVLAGRDKGKRGTILKILSNGKVLVDDVNIVKKHVKGNPQTGETGGIIPQEAPIQISNIAIYNAASGKGDRVGFKVDDKGKNVRIFKSTGEVVDV